MATDVSVSDSAVAALLQVRPQIRIVTTNLFAWYSAIEQEQSVGQHWFATIVARDLIHYQTSWTRKNGSKHVLWQIFIGDLLFVKNEELVVACHKAALDLEEVS